MQHPVKGYCYNVRGLCEEDNCECWKHVELLHENIAKVIEHFPEWPNIADGYVKTHKPTLSVEPDEDPGQAMEDRSPL